MLKWKNMLSPPPNTVIDANVFQIFGALKQNAASALFLTVLSGIWTSLALHDH